MQDICIDLGPCTVNLRAAAILRWDDRVLACRLDPDGYWFLPGGRIRTGETSRDAVHRELLEEIGQGFTLGPLTLSAENFFRDRGRTFHEICFFYEARWTAPDPPNPPAAATEILRWLTPAEITPLDLRPAFIKPHLLNPSPALKHVINQAP